MIYLDKTGLNIVILTIDCDANYAVNNYVLNIYSQLQQIDFTVNLIDTSIYPERYNSFVVSGISLTNLPSGYYNYNVQDTHYKTILETGKLFVNGISQPVTYKDVKLEKVKKYIDN